MKKDEFETLMRRIKYLEEKLEMFSRILDRNCLFVQMVRNEKVPTEPGFYEIVNVCGNKDIIRVFESEDVYVNGLACIDKDGCVSVEDADFVYEWIGKVADL